MQFTLNVIYFVIISIKFLTIIINIYDGGGDDNDDDEVDDDDGYR